MTDISDDVAIFRGKDSRKAILNSVTDLDAMRMAKRNPGRYSLSLSTDWVERMFGQFDLIRARKDAAEEKLKDIGSSLDPAISDIVATWCSFSGFPRGEATFKDESGFKQAVRDGNDIQVRRYMGDDGWAWIVVRDMHGGWMHRKRLPENVRAEMLRKRKERESRKP